jgi:hypothetical protein
LPENTPIEQTLSLLDIVDRLGRARAFCEGLCMAAEALSVEYADAVAALAAAALDEVRTAIHDLDALRAAPETQKGPAPATPPPNERFDNQSFDASEWPSAVEIADALDAIRDFPSTDFADPSSEIGDALLTFDSLALFFLIRVPARSVAAIAAKFRVLERSSRGFELGSSPMWRGLFQSIMSDLARLDDVVSTGPAAGARDRSTRPATRENPGDDGASGINEVAADPASVDC